MKQQQRMDSVAQVPDMPSVHAHTGTPASIHPDPFQQMSSSQDTDASTKESRTSLNSRRARMTAFSLLLAVPVALTACSDNDNSRCEYDQNGNPYNCDNYSSSSSSSHYKSSSSGSHSGFGSSGSFFSSFGG